MGGWWRRSVSTGGRRVRYDRIRSDQMEQREDRVCMGGVVCLIPAFSPDPCLIHSLSKALVSSSPNHIELICRRPLMFTLACTVLLILTTLVSYHTTTISVATLVLRDPIPPKTKPNRNKHANSNAKVMQYAPFPGMPFSSSSSPPSPTYVRTAAQTNNECSLSKSCLAHRRYAPIHNPDAPLLYLTNSLQQSTCARRGSDPRCACRC